MFWADRIAHEIIDSGKFKPYHVDDMFTPSGFPHIGSLRGPLIHDIVFRSLRDSEQEVIYTYVFNDFDPIDGLPENLKEKFEQYMGFPLRSAPSPEEGYESFADYFTADMKRVLESLGLKAQYLSSWDMYHEGRFNAAIKTALDNAEKIQDIYNAVSGSKKKEQGWLPLQVVCEKCGRLGTTRVFDWDGKDVSYKCEESLVVWAKGCGHRGKISPFDGNGKLPWKVDWPAHWLVLGVSVEGAGKDHSSAGGSRDIARELCNQVFKIPEPFDLPYEFFLLGGKKMGSSKEIGLKARELTSVLPAEVGRFLFTRTDYRQAIEFNPEGTTAIPDLFDEYNRCWEAYTKDSDENLSRAFVLAQVNSVPEKKQVFLPRFRDVANYLQLPNVDLQKQFELIKGSPCTDEELEILEERKKYAKVWLEKYAPEEFRWEFSESLPEAAKNLSDIQRRYLREIIPLVERSPSPDLLQTELYNKTHELDMSAKEAFLAIYLVTIGKSSGPRAAWFLLECPQDKLISRLKEAAQRS